MRRVRVPEVAPLDAHRLAHAQPGVIDQAEHGAVTRQLHRAQQRGDLFAGEHQRQATAAGRCAPPRRPSSPRCGDSRGRSAEGTAGELHGRAAELLLLAEEEEVGAELVLGERGRVALVMVGEPADVADVFLFGGVAKIFELDKRGELDDR